MWKVEALPDVSDALPLIYLIEIDTPFGCRRYVGRAVTKTKRRLHQDYKPTFPK
jgi:hypothetical protein